jgi:hypothetical protein
MRIRNKMKGIIDPISLGFLVALLGTLTAVGVDRPAGNEAVPAQVAQASGAASAGPAR